MDKVRSLTNKIKPRMNMNKLHNITNKMKHMYSSSPLYKYIWGAIIFLICILIGIWIYKKDILLTTNDNKMISNLDKQANYIKNFNINDATYQHNLRDYYIMSSYNSCCGGNFTNTYVDYVPLKQVIKRGARVLDFEIYSVNGKSVVAVSDNNNYYQKGSYNSLPFAEVMEKINNYAFSGSTAPNPNDPLFLHFRIKSKQPHVFDDMTKSLYTTFVNRKLGKEFAYEYSGENLGLIPLKELQGKVIIICSRENEIWPSTPLNEFVNIASGGQFLRELRNYDVQYTHNFTELLDSNKKNMSITMPDLSSSDKNMPIALHIKYGCQMICANFQSNDTNLEYYIKFFNDAGSAFALKPDNLRYIPKIMTPPKPQDPKLSYARRQISKPYFNHQI